MLNGNCKARDERLKRVLELKQQEGKDILVGARCDSGVREDRLGDEFQLGVQPTV